MAKRNYLVEGLSGTGKSSVYEELVRRGYTAITTDRAWAYSADPGTGLPDGPIGHDTWMWDRQKAVGELESPEPDAKHLEPAFANAGRDAPRPAIDGGCTGNAIIRPSPGFSALQTETVLPVARCSSGHGPGRPRAQGAAAVSRLRAWDMYRDGR